MKKKTHNLEFSTRLRELMIQRGFGSQNSASGVSPSALSKAIGCFNEMALRYLDGRSIPSPETLLKISEWLQVEPGYLLFGDRGFKPPTQEDQFIKINKDFLQYTLNEITAILKKTKQGEESEFIELYLNILTELLDMKMSVDDLKRMFSLTMKPILKSNDNGKSTKAIPSKVTS